LFGLLELIPLAQQLPPADVGQTGDRQRAALTGGIGFQYLLVFAISCAQLALHHQHFGELAARVYMDHPMAGFQADARRLFQFMPGVGRVRT
jgi:hypothetical protein